MSGHYWYFVTAILHVMTFFSTKIVVLVAILNNASFKWMARIPFFRDKYSNTCINRSWWICVHWSEKSHAIWPATKDSPKMIFFVFYWAICKKKEHFIEYLLPVLWLERNRCQNVWSFSMSQKEALTILSLKSDFKAYFTYKTLNIHIS